MTGTNDSMIMYDKLTENGRKELQPEGCNQKLSRFIFIINVFSSYTMLSLQSSSFVT
jgi:hypothetical protein